MKCSTKDCKNNSHELLTIDEEVFDCGVETLTQREVCPECFERITETCADCIIDPMDGDPDRSCNNCEQGTAEMLMENR